MCIASRIMVCRAVDAGREIDVNHGIVDVFAFQEALLIEAAFGIALLTMIWVGFRRWLQHKERMGRAIADERAEILAQFGACLERVEARLNAVEQLRADGTNQNSPEIDAPRSSTGPDANSTRGDVQADS